jgi:hypothetical protein
VHLHHQTLDSLVHSYHPSIGTLSWTPAANNHHHPWSRPSSPSSYRWAVFTGRSQGPSSSDEAVVHRPSLRSRRQSPGPITSAICSRLGQHSSRLSPHRSHQQRTPTMSPSPSLEAKIVVLGSQSVGKTSLVHRYVQNAWIDPRKVHSTPSPRDARHASLFPCWLHIKIETSSRLQLTTSATGAVHRGSILPDFQSPRS